MGHQSADTVAAGGARFTSLVRSPVDRFVAHYGLGDANGAEHDPRVTLMTNTGSVGQFRAGRVLVRGESSWPLASTEWTHFYLGGGKSGSSGSLNDGELVRDRPSTGGASDNAPLASGPHADLRTTEFAQGSGMRTDLRDDESAGLTYTTPVFAHDLEVSGPLSLRLFAKSTAPDFDWAVRVTDVWPDGRSEWITDGYLRASLRKVAPALSLRNGAGAIVRPWLTYDTPEQVPVGEPVEYRLDVIGTSNVFRKGHRLRLDVLPVAGSQADAPRSGGAGAVTVLRDAAHPSALTLPVIPGRCQRGAALTPGTAAVRCGAASPVLRRSCADKRRFRFKLHHGPRARVVRVRVYVNGRLRLRRHGRDIRTVVLPRLPRKRSVVRIVATQSSGSKLVSRRVYGRCTKGKPHTRRG
jgi:hypothetical protein